ncbi:MAG: flagellar biosynthesis anti-sigma factor FlgM [Terracidiphilus sp.]|jgi:flagellar biosynthesis anti-sigma factor FlgM
MNIELRNNLEGLTPLLRVKTAVSSAPQSKSNGTPATGTGFEMDRAPVRDAASEVSQAASGEGVRMEKVTAIQTALAAGTYHVPVSAVASKLVGTMLAGEQ